MQLASSRRSPSRFSQSVRWGAEQAIRAHCFEVNAVLHTGPRGHQVALVSAITEQLLRRAVAPSQCVGRVCSRAGRVCYRCVCFGGRCTLGGSVYNAGELHRDEDSWPKPVHAQDRTHAPRLIQLGSEDRSVTEPGKRFTGHAGALWARGAACGTGGWGPTLRLGPHLCGDGKGPSPVGGARRPSRDRGFPPAWSDTGEYRLVSGTRLERRLASVCATSTGRPSPRPVSVP